MKFNKEFKKLIRIKKAKTRRNFVYSVEQKTFLGVGPPNTEDQPKRCNSTIQQMSSMLPTIEFEPYMIPKQNKFDIF